MWRVLGNCLRIIPLFISLACGEDTMTMHRPGAMGPSNQTDERLLDPKEAGALGQVFEIRADISTTVAEPIDTNTLSVDRLTPLEVGSTFITRKLNGRKLSAKNQKNPSVITLAVESIVSKLQPVLGAGHAQETILQGILQYGTGAGQQGVQPSTVLPFAGAEIDGRIIFDIDTGVFLSFPAAYFQLDFLYTSVCKEGFGTVNDIVGPNYQVTFSLGYEPQVHLGEVTMTKLLPQRDLAIGDTATFARPKYSTGIYFQWHDWGTGGVTPLTISFTNANGQTVWLIVGYSSAVLPPVVLPWPADAVAVNVGNLSGAVMGFFRAVNILEF